MNRFIIIIMKKLCPAALTLAASALFLLAVPAGLGADRNVILFVTDDQGLDAGCYGNPVIQTPNLDALAADGTMFQYAFCTTASCSASRSVILTGRHNHANGHYGHQHSYHKFSSFADAKSLPVLLESAGYRTARIGKYHVAPESVYQFDTVLRGNGRNAVQMARASEDFIAARNDRPFFLYFCTSDPHRGGTVSGRNLPATANRDRLAQFDQNINSFGNRSDGYPGVETVRYRPEEVLVPDYLPDTETCRTELAQYYQSVSRIDQGLGELVKVLKKHDLYDNTLILYISDHGIAFPGAKTTVYEPGLRSPCIVRNPYIAARGVSNRAMISWVDLVPTILDFAKATPDPAPFHGRSFLSVLDQTHPEGWDKIYASHTFHEITMYYPMRVVRNRRYKLIWNLAHDLPYPFASDLWVAPTWQEKYMSGQSAIYGKRTVDAYMHRAEFELYDLESDPHEIRNLAGADSHRVILGELKEDLKAFQERTDDPWALKWHYE